jgi:hypothetical protein
MARTALPLLFLLLYAVVPSRAPVEAQAPAPQALPAAACGPLGSAYMRTNLYFGLNRKTGSVSEPQWRAFLRDVVTPHFPQGLTVWEAGGQWRRADGAIVKERSKVLLLVHDDSAAVRASIADIVERYKQSFKQESVLWETARVCAAF